MSIVHALAKGERVFSKPVLLTSALAVLNCSMMLHVLDMDMDMGMDMGMDMESRVQLDTCVSK